MSKRVTISVSLRGLPPESASCRACFVRLADRVQALGDVEGIQIQPERGQVLLDLRETADVDRVRSSTEKIIREVASGFSHRRYRIGGMDCPQCAESIQERVERLPGVLSCTVDFPMARMVVEFDATQVAPEQIEAEVRRLGYSARPVTAPAEAPPSREWLFLGVAVLLYLIGGLYGHESPVGNALFAAALVVSGYPMLRSGLLSLLTFNFTTNALMTIAVIGASGIGELSEAALVAILYRLGSNLQDRAIRRTRSAIGELLASAPKTAEVEREGAFREIEVTEIIPGDRVRVRSFSVVPVDGTVETGTGYVDTSVLTGETEPAPFGPGSPVLAGSSTTEAPLTLVATRRYADTTYAKTLELIEAGGAHKAQREQAIERLSRWYTPLVIALAVSYAVLTIALGLHDASDALHRSFWLLMLACPCALVISIPVAVTTAIGTASRMGALVKGGAVLEALERVRIYVLDKTGTLTYARLQVDEVALHRPIPDSKARGIAAALASNSNHPVSRAVAACATEVLRALDVQEIPGEGLEGVAEGRRYRLGSAAFTGAKAAEGRRAVYLADEEGLVATLFLSEQLKQEAREVAATLQKSHRLVLVSGDRPEHVAALAESIGVAEWKAGVTPEQKVEIVRELKRDGPVAMVGDGVNDVAALMESDVGIAMGAAGTDAAVDAADIVVLNDDVSALVRLDRLSRELRAIVNQNIVFSLLTKAVLVAVGVLYPLGFWVAVGGDMGVSLLVTANSLRLRR